MLNDNKKDVYFDNAATTKVCDESAKKALEIMTELYGNPSSVHPFGMAAKAEMENARKNVVKALGFGINDGELIFTSSGTEAANLALLGYARLNKRKGTRILISDSEHPCVFNAANKLSDEGFEVIHIPTRGGKLDLDFAKSVMNENVLLISCMTVNNETGALYDLASLDNLRKQLCPGAVFHTDSVQAFTKTTKDIRSLCPQIDMVSVSSHKIHAPKGCGALWIRKGIRLMPIVFGGEQESGLRPGTEALPNICAFGAAAKKSSEESLENYEKVLKLRNYAKEKLLELCEDVVFNEPNEISPYILSVVVPGIRSEIMLRKLSEKGIYVSAGSACSSKKKENRVLKAFGLDENSADFTIRVSFSEYNTFEEADLLAYAVAEGKKSIIPVKVFRRKNLSE